MNHWKMLIAGATVALFAAPASALAARGVATADVNMRAGPGTEFPVVATIPDHARLEVLGCLDDRDWCDVAWSGNRGWVAASYLNYFYNNSYVYLPDYFDTVDVPIVTFSFGPYWRRYYAHRPWYHHRSRWADVWRRHPGHHHGHAGNHHGHHGPTIGDHRPHRQNFGNRLSDHRTAGHRRPHIGRGHQFGSRGVHIGGRRSMPHVGMHRSAPSFAGHGGGRRMHIGGGHAGGRIGGIRSGGGARAGAMHGSSMGAHAQGGRGRHR
jgi:uncharacterized protein YraI